MRRRSSSGGGAWTVSLAGALLAFSFAPVDVSAARRGQASACLRHELAVVPSADGGLHLVATVWSECERLRFAGEAELVGGISWLSADGRRAVVQELGLRRSFEWLAEGESIQVPLGRVLARSSVRVRACLSESGTAFHENRRGRAHHEEAFEGGDCLEWDRLIRR